MGANTTVHNVCNIGYQNTSLDAQADNNRAQVWAKTRVGPKLVFLHPSAESGQLSSVSMSPEFRSFALLYVHADHFINDCAYGSIGFIILDMSCECFFMYSLLLMATW